MRTIIFSCTLLFCTVCLAYPADSILTTIQSYEYEHALRMIDNAPDNTPYIFYKVQALKGLNRYSETIETLQAYLEQEPDHQRALIEIAECYKSTGNLLKALEYYGKAYQNNPENNFIRIQYFYLLIQAESYEKAHTIGKVLVDRGDPTGYRFLGRVYEGLQQNDSAIVCYEEAIRLKPTDYLSVASVANLYISRNEPEEAILYTENYRSLDSLNLLVNRQNAKAYCLDTNYPVAIERYTQLVKAGDRSFQTNYYLGVSHYAQEEFFEAQEYLEKAYKQEPKNVNLLYYLARACARSAWKEEGVSYMKQALEYTIPENATLAKLYRGLAECHRVARQPHEQIKALEKLYEYDPEAKSTLYSIGLVYQDRLKDNKNAIRYLEEFMKTRSPINTSEAVLNEAGELVMEEDTYYKAAEQRLKKLKEEEFFKTGQQ